MRLRDTIATHFERIERDKRYLSMLAIQHPQVYCALVAKVIPQQVAVDVTHHVIDLGALMIEAHATLRELRDITPTPSLAAPADYAPATGGARNPPQSAAPPAPVAGHTNRVRRFNKAGVNTERLNTERLNVERLNGDV